MTSGDSDFSVEVGSLTLKSAVLTASGTSGHGAELSAFFDIASLGAIVVKSLSAEPWPGNPPPRVHPVAGGMLNSVGLQGPGVAAWIDDELPDLERAGATVVASIWGRTVDEFARAAELLKGAGPAVVAIEVNISCPNVEDRSRMFAQSPTATEEAVSATAACGKPRWAKLSPNVSDIAEIASAALAAGAEALTLINTVVGLAVDIEKRAPVLGGIGGGLSGPAIHAVACRAVFDCHRALPEAPIIGVGGVSSGEDAIELLLAGASAIGVGTATLADPRAPIKIAEQMERWCVAHGVRAIRELTGGAHG